MNTHAESVKCTRTQDVGNLGKTNERWKCEVYSDKECQELGETRNTRCKVYSDNECRDLGETLDTGSVKCTRTKNFGT